MAETVTVQGTATEGRDNTQGTRTFTQTELDEIIKDRVKRERDKFADYETLKEKAGKFDAQEEANKTELQKATEKAAALQLQVEQFTKAEELRSIREKVSKETGVPASLLTGDTEEVCKTQASGILAFAKPDTYPEIQDGGEVQNIKKKSTQEQFAEWFAESI